MHGNTFPAAWADPHPSVVLCCGLASFGGPAPRHADLSDQVPPLRGHRLAFVVPAVPVLHPVDLEVLARDCNHEGVLRTTAVRRVLSIA